MDYAQKGYKIALIALVIALISLNGTSTISSLCNCTNGTNGTNGINGINGTNGTAGINGVNGTNGTNGINGINGTNGTAGINGVNGTNGTVNYDLINQSLYTKINKSGDNVSGQLNFITQGQSIRLISDPATYTYSVVNETGSQTASADFANFIIFANFRPSYNVTISQLSINVYYTTTGLGRLAIYTDTDNVPDVLLNETSSIVLHMGWNNLTLPNTSIVGNKTYWMAQQTLYAQTSYYVTGGTQRQRGGYGYGAFPNPAESSEYTNTVNLRASKIIGGGGYNIYCINVTSAGVIYTAIC